MIDKKNGEQQNNKTNFRHKPGGKRSSGKPLKSYQATLSNVSTMIVCPVSYIVDKFAFNFFNLTTIPSLKILNAKQTRGQTHLICVPVIRSWINALSLVSF
jgi:hypothetical protein